MNQILVSSRVYVTKEMRRKQIFYKITFIMSIILIFVLLTYYVFAERDRLRQEATSQEILQSLQIADETVIDDPVIVVNLNYEEDLGEIAIDSSEEPETTSTSSESTYSSDGSWYSTESVFSFPRLGINYPVLSETSNDLLKISLNKYWGPAPNSAGNYCIVGHNYSSGKMFGKLKDAYEGDTVYLTDLSNNTVTYVIYRKYVVEPTDVSCTSQLTNGRKELTLITCTNFGKQRLVLKCREVV